MNWTILLSSWVMLWEGFCLLFFQPTNVPHLTVEYLVKNGGPQFWGTVHLLVSVIVLIAHFRYIDSRPFRMSANTVQNVLLWNSLIGIVSQGLDSPQVIGSLAYIVPLTVVHLLATIKLGVIEHV